MSLKQILRVWGLPDRDENDYKQLFKALVQVAINHKYTVVKKPKDLIVLFPTYRMQFGLGSEIVLEYLDSKYLGGDNDLAAGLGVVTKAQFPEAFVQVTVWDNHMSRRGIWSSASMTSRKLIKKLIAAAEKQMPAASKECKNSCYCKDNACDHKGPCHHCNHQGHLKYAIKKGGEILELPNGSEFQTEASLLVQDCPELYQAVA